MNDFCGKKVLVTGSTQGIGLATAKEFSALGGEVWIHCSHDIKKAERIANEIGAAHAVTADLSDTNETLSLYHKTGPVDILILNASVQYKSYWKDITIDQFENQVNVNLRSTFLLMQAYYPHMEKNHYGRIITVGSVNQHRQHSELAIYAATKCAVMSIVRNVAKTAAPHGVTINNISPGAILTPRNESVWNDPQKRSAVEAQIPVGRFGNSEEIAKTIVFLCGEYSEYFVGEDITIDGGMHL